MRKLMQLELTGSVSYEQAGVARQKTKSIKALSQHLMYSNAS